MRNPLRNFLSSCLATLLVPTLACTKADFVRDNAGGGGAGGETGGAGSGGETGGAGSGGETGDAGGGGEPGDAEGVADAGLGPEAGMICPAPSVSLCPSSKTPPCDPVCQTGTCEWCGQKCSYAFNGVNTQATCAGKGPKTFPQACKVASSGPAYQDDDCAPGSICLPPIIGDDPTFCFSLCHSAAECLYGVACGPRKLSSAGGQVYVCDPPYDPCGTAGTCCDPLGGGGCGANRVCFLVSPDLGSGSGHSRTVCEFSFGDGRNGSSCDSSRDCQLKNTCVNNTCRQVCNSANACANNGLCTLWGTEYGYCPK